MTIYNSGASHYALTAGLVWGAIGLTLALDYFAFAHFRLCGGDRRARTQKARPKNANCTELQMKQIPAHKRNLNNANLADLDVELQSGSGGLSAAEAIKLLVHPPVLDENSSLSVLLGVRSSQ